MKQKCVLYGINRVAKDFWYMFSDRFEVIYFLDDNPKIAHWRGRPVFAMDQMPAIAADEIVIVCSFEKTINRDRLHKLESRGIKKGIRCFLAEDFFKSLDYYVVPNRPVVVWGTGMNAEKLLACHPEFEITLFIDAKKDVSEFHGYPVKKPEEIKNWQEIFVIVAFARDSEAVDLLEEQGLTYPEDYINARIIYDSPSRLLQQTIFDRSNYSFTCNTVLNHLEIVTNGNTAVCCTTFMEKGLDRFKNMSADDMWNSVLHKVLALSTENRSYTFCLKNMCPLFIGKMRRMIGDSFVPSEDEYKVITHKPKVVALGYDSTCNLMCETCRNEVRIAHGREKKEAAELSDLIVSNEFLQETEFLIEAGDGEVFLSQAYRNVYMHPVCNDIDYIRFLTNGTLFTPDKWEEFRRGKKGKVMLTVSVDAATQETYEQIRRNGNFRNLSRNMEFAARLKHIGELAYFRMNFVVQRRNYKEMPDFVKWAKELGCDEAFFTKILNWGTYSQEQFKDISMMEDDGITPKLELKEILELPIMKDPIVDLGTIQYNQLGISEKYIENYYMWEMHRKKPDLFKNYFKLGDCL